ncbi:MAG TPA: hypothetical protein PK349_09675 [Candidatus Hydrogenedentes bacterium]|nr:hypothetical protein [Candidatus Hydrogenedentota bacterium]
MAPESARKEEIKQALLVVGSVLALFMLITGIALFFNRGAASPLASPPSKRFTAKSGTTRDRALALVSRKQTARVSDSDTGDRDQEKQEQKQRRIRARMLSDLEETRPLTETQRKVREALNTLDPDEGLRKLQALLEQTRDDRERGEIYEAMSELYLQQDMPDVVAAEKMLDAALSTAPDTATRARVLLRQAELCAARGAPQLALAKIQAELRRMGDGMDPAALPLMTARGFLLEAQGNAEEAEAAYRDVLRRAEGTPGPEVAESARDAGMRLTRLLRDHQRDAEADDVVRRVATLSGGGMEDFLSSPGRTEVPATQDTESTGATESGPVPSGS